MLRTRIAISCFALVGFVCLSLFLYQAWFKPEPKDAALVPDSESLPPIDTSNPEIVIEPPVSHREEAVVETPVTTLVENTPTTSDIEMEPYDVRSSRVALTDFRGEMKKGKLANKPFVDVSTHPSFPWFTKDASTIVIPDSKESFERDYFFGWVQLNPNHLHSINNHSFQALRVELFDSGNEYRRARLPREPEVLEKLLDHDAVLALGVKPIDKKMGPNFREEIAAGVAGDYVEVFITLMTTKNLAHWRKQLENLGATIEHWDPTIRVFVAFVPNGKIVELAERDFVQAIDPVGIAKLTLDSAVTVAGADGLRLHVGVNGTFSGITGEDITVGIVDTGLNIAHPDISENRDSICGESFQTLSTGQLDTDDLWFDVAGHGTHVTSIFTGTGVEDPSRAGFAPGVKHIRFAKAFAKSSVFASTTSILKSMDYFTEESSCEWNGIESEERKPNVVNMSLSGVTADAGYHVGAKKLDWAVWDHNQVYVVSQGNARKAGYSQYGSAKNALSVGWLSDALFANFRSSFGPTSDGRMVPKVSMSGDNVLAADGAGARSGYTRKSGTSMSSPAVAGIATLLMGTDDGFKNNPALVRAQLMATAIKADAYFDDDSAAPMTNTDGTGNMNKQYGMGAVSARTAITQGPNGEWSSHSAVSELENDEYAYIEIEVPEGTERLDIVLTWDEPPNDNVGSAVMSDLDLYLGPDEDCDVTVCGEFASSSRVDNLEYLIIANPEAGTKRITVIPHNVFQFAPRIAVSWMFIRQSTPQLDIELDSDTLDTENIRRPTLELTVTSDAFVAGGVSLYIACREQIPSDCDYWNDSELSLWQPGSQVTREDGTVQDLSGLYIGDAVFLGEIVSSEVQNVTLVFPPAIKTRSHQLYLSVAGSNALSDVQGVNVQVDDVELPALATVVSNKNSSTAIVLSGESGTAAVDLAAGARQPGELAIDNEVRLYFETRRWYSEQLFRATEGYNQSRSAWYKLKVAAASKYGIQVLSKLPRDVNVSFQLVEAEEMFNPHPSHLWWAKDRIEFYLQPDKDYYLRVNTYEPTRVPSFQFVWEKLDIKPVNDHFVESIELTGENGEISGNNAYATVEHGEPGGHVSVGTTWFNWVAPEDGTWSFDAVAPYSSEPPQIFVFHGSSLEDLRLISDPSFFDADVPVVADEEYQICVSSNAQLTGFQGSYELSWSKGRSWADLATNDLFNNATLIYLPQGTRATCLSCRTRDRTVEVDEPSATNSHSLWWEFRAPSTNKFTFRIRYAQVDTLSIFSGSELSELTLEGSGPEVVLDATDGESYYISIHRNSGLEYTSDGSINGNRITWGETPEYDRISAPLTMDGTSGWVRMALKYATTTADETQAMGLTSTGVHSSGWGSWTAPTNFSGWMKFSTDTWEEAELGSATDQYFLGIHERDDANSRWNLITSTDRSFIISGKPHAIFKPESGNEYRVQAALRSNRTRYSNIQAEFKISWEETTAPSWLISDLDFYEIGSPSGNNIEELIDPTAGAVVGRDLDQLLIAGFYEMLVLGLSDGTDDLNVLETIPYEDENGPTIQGPKPLVLGWNSVRQVVYAPLNNDFMILEGLDQAERAFSRCQITSDFDITPTQIISESTGRYIYKIAEDTISVYRVDGPCEFTLVQVSTASSRRHSLRVELDKLDGLRSATFGPNESYLYGLSDDWLLTFAKDEDTGELNVVSNTFHLKWLDNVGVGNAYNRFGGARVVLDPSGDYLFAFGENNPSVAIFDLATDRETPTPLATLDRYYIGDFRFFPSHIRRPYRWDLGQCRIATIHNTDNPTIDVFCRRMNFVVTFDRDSEELYISDWSSNEQPDRFGNNLPMFRSLAESFGVRSPNGRFSYVVVNDWIDSIHRFERVTGANPITPPETFEPYDSYLVRLVAMDVEPNEIVLGSRTITDCEAISDLNVDDVTYTVLNSKWQVRDAVGEDWVDVSGTVRTDNQLCPHDPTDTRDYRLAFEATIDGITEKYSSDVMVEQPNSE